ncbi:ABC transporter permease [Methylobacterium oryzisoli]|uniref:ABC transporter permease n=1 Tax=Methylobacterium oryzisoli TaxID=3385502 RepID=UPI003892322C
MTGNEPLRPTLRRRATSLALFLALMAAWEAAIRLLKVPAFVLPAPSAILSALGNGLSSGLYLKHLGVTFAEVVAGFALGSGLGFLLGVAIATNRYVAYFLYPYIVVVQSLPKVAIAPLIVLWFGLGIMSKIVSAALICFFAVMVNTVAGLRAVDEDRVDLMRSLDASNGQIFRMLRLPAALPFIMAGLEIALTFALIGAIVAEFLGAESGLGMLMQSMNFSMDVAGSFSVLVVLAVLGLSLNQLIGFVRRRLIYWERSPPRAAEAPEKTPARAGSP